MSSPGDLPYPGIEPRSPALQTECGRLGSIRGSGRSPGGGNDYLPQYSCWRIPWTEDTRRLQSMGSQKVFVTFTFRFSLLTK